MLIIWHPATPGSLTISQWICLSRQDPLGAKVLHNLGLPPVIDAGSPGLAEGSAPGQVFAQATELPQ